MFGFKRWDFSNIIFLFVEFSLSVGLIGICVVIVEIVVSKLCFFFNSNWYLWWVGYIVCSVVDILLVNVWFSDVIGFVFFCLRNYCEFVLVGLISLFNWCRVWLMKVLVVSIFKSVVLVLWFLSIDVW